MIKVSIIVPVYNTSKYLSHCLDSLVNQTLDSIEIIIVNDWSTDNSKDIIDTYISKYSHIKYIYQDNQGLSWARNTWMWLATWEYIWFVDSDDSVELEMFEKMYTLAIQENVDIVWCETKVIFHDHITYFHIPKDYKNKDISISPLGFTVWSKIFRKSFIDTYSLKFQLNKRFEDWLFMSDAYDYNPSISAIHETLYNYSKREDAITQSFENPKTLERLDLYIYLYNKSHNIAIYKSFFKSVHLPIFFYASLGWYYQQYHKKIKPIKKHISRNLFYTIILEDFSSNKLSYKTITNFIANILSYSYISWYPLSCILRIAYFLLPRKTLLRISRRI